MTTEFNENIAYKKSIDFAKSHYENFPVISLFLKKEIRKDIAVVYQFARQADDIADELKITAEERLQLLEKYENNLKDCLNDSYTTQFWFIVSILIKKNNLTTDNF
ncbi:MAG: squalene/phytoene synthase family protein, partial [Ignavibacteriales bacterium]|nr:squalene/phytoene synthase family protein [Ignavibacteriales bacterium]